MSDDLVYDLEGMDDDDIRDRPTAARLLMEKAAAEIIRLRTRVAELEGLVRTVLENDVLVLAKEDIVLPGSFTFETISKLDAWRNKARAALEGKKDE